MKAEELKNAELEMLMASIDYDDNRGSVDRMEFWERFEKARNNYRLIKDKEATRKDEING